MTKKQIIEEIQAVEAKLWFKLNEYDYCNAPRYGNIDNDMNWDSTDTGHRYHLHAWSAVHAILEAINAECSVNDHYHEKAEELSMKLYKERISVRGEMD